MNGNLRTEGRHETPHIINQLNMLGYQKLSPVIIIIVIMTVEWKRHCKSKLFFTFSKGLTWRQCSDGQEHELMMIMTVLAMKRRVALQQQQNENGVAVLLKKRKTKQKKRKTAEMRGLHGDISSQVLMRSKLDKASWSAHIVLNTAMRNAMMIMMVW